MKVFRKQWGRWAFYTILYNEFKPEWKIELGILKGRKWRITFFFYKWVLIIELQKWKKWK